MPHDPKESVKRYTARALPAYRHLPGETPHPIKDPEGHMFGHPHPEGSDSELFLYGVDLYNHDYFWEAHEAWETVWKNSTPRAPETIFLQGLIQLAATGLKQVQNLDAGFEKLRVSALEKLSQSQKVLGSVYMGVELAPLVDWLERGYKDSSIPTLIVV